MIKGVFTREEVISIIDNILERGDAVFEAITSEAPQNDAEDFLKMAENDLFTEKI